MRVGDQIAEAYAAASPGQRGARRASGRSRCCEAVQIRDPERVCAALSARDFGRHGPARDDRDDAGRRSREVLIADEPTSALDVTVRLEVLAHARRAGARARHRADLHQPRPQPRRAASATACSSCIAGAWWRTLPAGRTRRTPSTPIRAACSPRCRASAVTGSRGCRVLRARPGLADACECSAMIEVENSRSASARTPCAPAVDTVSASRSRAGETLRPRRRIRAPASRPSCARIAGLDRRLGRRDHASRHSGRARPRPRPSAAACRWCSRTPTARCIRARPIGTQLMEPLRDPRPRPTARRGSARRWRRSACRAAFR